MIPAHLLKDWENEAQGYIKMVKKNGFLPENEAPFDLRILCLITELKYQETQNYHLKNGFLALKEFITDPRGQEILESCLKSWA